MEQPLTQKALTTMRSATLAVGRLTREASRTRLNQLAAIFFVSGVAGLVFELLWVRVLSLTFGVTSYAISTVLAGFMAGLALGSAGAGRLADRLRDPLRAYAIIEVLIGVTGLLTLPAFAAMQELYRSAHPYLANSTALLSFWRFGLAFLIMLIPTSMMGATLPILLRSSLLRSSHAGSHLSLLYAVNTAGAIVGCLLPSFLLIGNLGVRRSILLAASLNALAALLALWLRASEKERTNTEARRHGGDGEDERDGTAEEPPAAHTPLPTSDSLSDPSVSPCLRVDPYPPATRKAVFWVIGLSGLLSLSYEVVWARLLATLFDATVYSFAIMLAVFLLGLAVGSAAMKPLMRRPLPWPAMLAAVEFLIGAASLLSVIILTRYGWNAPPIFSWIPFLGPLLGDEDLRYTSLVSFMALFPATFLMGASFPIAAHIYTEGLPDLGRRVGAIYAVNVCGSIFGSLLGGFVLLPALGVEQSMELLATGNGLLGLALLMAASDLRPAHRIRWALGGALLLVVLLLSVPPPYLTLFASRFPGQRVLWREEGIENTVTVVQTAEQRIMYLNGHHQANDSPGMINYHRQIGHLPVLLHPNPRRALVIGLGGGATPGAIAQHPNVTVECVELSPSVVRGAQFFARHNDDVLNQPNLVLRIDDGRNHLFLTRRKYDVITADVIMPHHAGSGNLYSQEYYQLCRNALGPNGLMCQWVWKNSPSQYQMMLRTFLRAFPYVTLWEDGTLLIGSNQPIRLSREAIARKFAAPQARASLATVGVRSVEDVLKKYTGTREEILAYVGDGPIITDDRPLIEYYRSSEAMREVVSLGRIQRDLHQHFRNRTPPAVD